MTPAAPAPDRPKKRVTVLSPCYNEVDNVRPLFEAVKAQFEKEPGYEFTQLFIDNCSTDGTRKVLREMAAADPRVQVIFNVRNFGHVRSPMHGLLSAGGDAVIGIVSDFQDPPELIPDYLRKWEEGYKLVLGVKVQSNESRLMYAVRSLYYRLVARMSDVELTRHMTGSGLVDRVVIEELRKIGDPYPYFRGLVAEIGYPIAKIPYTQPNRRFGVTKNNFYRLFDIAMLGFTNHSKVPLRLMTIGGFLLSGLSLVMAVAYLIAKLVFWDWLPAGAAPMLISLFFFGSLQMFFLGVLGEYVGAILTQVQKRPLVVEEERLNFNPPATAHQ